jgi:hypothetical protein
MPLTFAEAYAKVCPEGGAVVPNSKEYNDIMELMRQSGHTTYKDRLVQDTTPRIPQTVEAARRYIETPEVMPQPLKISKRQWLSVEANRQSFLNALNKNKTKS